MKIPINAKVSKNKNRLSNPCATCPTPCDPIRTAGSRKAKILIVTKGPKLTGTELNRVPSVDRFFRKAAADVFVDTAKSHGFDYRDFVYHAAVRCSMPEETTPPRDRKATVANCREFLLRTIEKLEPDVIVPMGADAATQVNGRATKITKARGLPEWNEDFNCWVYPMMDPDYVAMYPQNETLFEADWRRLGDLIENGFNLAEATRQGECDYQIIDDLQFLIDMDPSVLAFDTETMGTRWAYEDKKLLTMQFCVEPGTAYILPWDHPDMPMKRRQRRKLKSQLEELLCNPDRDIIGHNLKYDVMWVWEKLGFRFCIRGDTLNLAALVDENMQAKDLSTLTKMFIPEMGGYDDWFNQTYDKAHMELVPLDHIREYGCGDVDACLRLFDIFMDEIAKDPALENYYYTVTIPALNMFASMERRGMPVQETKLDDLEQEVGAYVAELFEELIAEVPRSIKREHIEKGLKFSRHDFTRDILFYHPDGFCLEPKVFTKSTEKLSPELRIASTSSKDHLPFFFDECPWAEKLAEYNKLERLLGTNIVKFRENYILGDKIYPTYNLHIAVTGRTASADPNAQNFPKRGRFAKTYRSIFLPPPGWVMLEADLSQAELRIAADMAAERTMLRIYGSGGDIHRITALIVSGLTEDQFNQLPGSEQALYRFKAKAVNFGFIYGMGWRKFIIYAKTQYGVEFTAQEAQRIRNQFFGTYSGLVNWHRAMRDFARANSYVRSYSGRVRHLPTIHSVEEYIQRDAERQAINSPVQEFASTLGVLAGCRIDQYVDPAYLRMSGFVHDALYFATPPQYVEWGAKTVKRAMETVPIEDYFGVRMRVPIVADVSFGFDGGHQYEMGGLSLDAPFDFDALERELLDAGEIEEPFGLPPQLVPPRDGEANLPAHLILEMVA